MLEFHAGVVGLKTYKLLSSGQEFLMPDHKPSHVVTLLSERESLLTSVNDAIEHYYSDPQFGFDQLAETIGMSKDRLQRKLVSMKIDPPAMLIRNARLDKSIELINANFGNVSEVAYKVGFLTPNSFLQAFKKRFKATPYEMMKQRANYGKIVI